jgi:membrane protease YdiL (CAAX protease family)
MRFRKLEKKITGNNYSISLSKSLAAFFLFAYFISWFIFVRLALNHQGIIFFFADDPAHARTQDLWHSLGGLGPLIAAIMVLRISFGKSQWKIFLDGYSIRKPGLSGWLLAFSPLFLFIFSVTLAGVLGHGWYAWSSATHANGLHTGSDVLIWCLPLLTYGFGEEAGWRGFALPCLQGKYSALKATSILSIFWICWHIPTFFYRYNFSWGMLAGFLAGLFAGAIVLTSIYNFTKGSTLAVSLWHTTFNTVSMLAKGEYFITAVMNSVIMVAAILIVWKFGKTNLSPVARSTFETE